MIHWRDEALILSYKRHGESHALLEILTKAHGRHKGIVQGGGSRKHAPNLQPGLVVSAEYSARLEEHLGTFKIEPAGSYVVGLMNDPVRLLAFQSIIAMIQFSMEERDPHPRLYQETLAWLQDENYMHHYLRWEIVLLSEAGFELDLETCAVSGVSENLLYISPKTGRAVSAQAAGEWADRLLPYSPAFQSENCTLEEIRSALEVTEFFLNGWLAKMIGKAKLPEIRERLIARLYK